MYTESMVFTEAKPRHHSECFGRRVLLLTRGFKPHIDVLQGPNMTSLPVVIQAVFITTHPSRGRSAITQNKSIETFWFGGNL